MSPTFEEAINEQMTKFKGNYVMKQQMKQKIHRYRKVSRFGVTMIQRQYTSITLTFMFKTQHHQSWD